MSDDERYTDRGPVDEFLGDLLGGPRRVTDNRTGEEKLIQVAPGQSLRDAIGDGQWIKREESSQERRDDSRGSSSDDASANDSSGDSSNASGSSYEPTSYVSARPRFRAAADVITTLAIPVFGVIGVIFALIVAKDETVAKIGAVVIYGIAGVIAGAVVAKACELKLAAGAVVAAGFLILAVWAWGLAKEEKARDAARAAPMRSNPSSRAQPPVESPPSAGQLTQLAPAKCGSPTATPPAGLAASWSSYVCRVSKQPKRDGCLGWKSYTTSKELGCPGKESCCRPAQ
jgi:hypothetical protein